MKKTESGVNFWAVKNVEIFGLQWSISEVYDMLKYLNKLEQNIKIGLVPLGKELDILLASSYMITKSWGYYGKDWKQQTVPEIVYSLFKMRKKA